MVYDYFFPAYKAGGPVQSLTNLIISLQSKYKVAVLTGGYDLNESHSLSDVTLNEWLSINLQPNLNPIKVWYGGKGKPGVKQISQCIEDVNASVVYLNGMFSYRFVLLPLFKIKKQDINIVICPRGMLQSGALAGKSFKKSIYLTMIKLFGLTENVTWHATNDEEKKDIRKIFGNAAKVIIAPNIPKCPVKEITPALKEKGKLKLVYLSLISEKKNLFQLIKLVSKSIGITLDIYGPVKDIPYWETCKEFIKNNEDRIKYLGDVMPEFVQKTFMNYDASILLTKGENFGHALYESLSAGRPIITSFFTPWEELETKMAGWNLDITDDRDCISKLESIRAMDEELFNSFCSGAHKLAKDYYENSNATENYIKLFEV